MDKNQPSSKETDTIGGWKSLVGVTAVRSEISMTP
jgi:hypothetical protein